MEKHITLTDIVVQCIDDALEMLTPDVLLYIRIHIAESQQLHIIAQKNEYGNIRTGHAWTSTETMPSQFTQQGVYSPDMWKGAGITFLHGVSGVITYHVHQKVQDMVIVDDTRKTKLIVTW